LGRMRNLQSMLGRELLGGAIAVILGKVARLPILYAGRSLGPSASYVNWHPIEFLVSSPQSLFNEYIKYRELLLELYSSLIQLPSEEIINQIDMAHLRYLSEYLKPEVVDYLINKTRHDVPREEIVNGLWPILAPKVGLAKTIQANAKLQKLRRSLFPWLRYYHFKRVLTPSLHRVGAVTEGGVVRNYEIYKEFTDNLTLDFPKNTLSELIEVLNSYE
jgi:hypothetical protein